MKIINTIHPNSPIKEVNLHTTAIFELTESENLTALNVKIGDSTNAAQVTIELVKFEDESFVKEFVQKYHGAFLLAEINEDLDRHNKYRPDCFFDIRDYINRWQLRTMELMAEYAVNFLISQSK